MDKAVIGLIASLGIIGAIATKNSNKVKDAETFMANMRAQTPQGVAWNDKVGRGIGVRKIPRNKLNFTAFDKDLPAFIPNKMRTDWDKLESANWQEINQLAYSVPHSNRGQNLSIQYNQLSHFGGGIEYPMELSHLEYSNLANRISSLSQTYSQNMEYEAVKKDGKKAITAFKKLNANLEKGIKDYKQQRHLQVSNVPKVAKYAAFKTFMDSVFNGAQALAKVRGTSPPDRKKFDEFMAQLKNPPANGVSMEYRNAQRYVLNTLSNLNYNLSQGRQRGIDYAINTYRGLVNHFANHPFVPKGFNPQGSSLYNLDLAMQDPKRVSYILEQLTVNELARLYQYGMFFNDNPTIRFVGAKTRPWNKREELYFPKYAYREEMNTWQVLPKGLRISKTQYVDVLSRRCVALMRLLKSIESKADNLARIKGDASRKSIENATKAVIGQVQKALDGKGVKGRFGRSFYVYDGNESKLTQEQKADLALSIIEYPERTMPSLSIMPSIEIETYFGGIDENGMPLLESQKVNLMQNTNLLNTVKADEVLKGLTLDPAMKGEIENRLNARYQQAIASNDRSIAKLAQQMTRYIENKDTARKEHDKALNLLDFAF